MTRFMVLYVQVLDSKLQLSFIKDFLIGSFKVLLLMTLFRNRHFKTGHAILLTLW